VGIIFRFRVPLAASSLDAEADAIAQTNPVIL